MSEKTIQMLKVDAECKLRDFIGNGIWGSKTLNSEQGDKIIQAIGDYCIERMKEECNNLPPHNHVTSEMAEHLKECHSLDKRSYNKPVRDFETPGHEFFIYGPELFDYEEIIRTGLRDGKLEIQLDWNRSGWSINSILGGFIFRIKIGGKQ